MNPTDRVFVELLIAAPIDTVWRALRDPKEIARWFGWEHPGLAEEIEMIFNGFEATEATHTLQSANYPDRCVLDAFGPDHTIVRLIRSAPTTDKSWQGIYDDAINDWLTFIEQLRFFLTRHQGADRRTLFLNGRAATADVPPLADALGLTRLAIVPIGQRYSVKTAMGDTLEGEVWFRSATQIGLIVDGYGDGLITVTTRPSTAKSPYGGGKIVITTYGLDDARFAGLRTRWSDWLRSRYEVIEIQPA
jgi:uncharacterized protein YndB with AHSA1/START domain